MKSNLLFLAFIFSCFQMATAQNFTENTGTIFKDLDSGSIAFSDVDGDGDQDVLITGNDVSFEGHSILYLNDGDGNFTEEASPQFVSIHFSSIAFSDVDGDGDEDVLITGGTNTFSAVSRIYLNDGAGNFTLDIVGSVPLTGVDFGAIAFADIDNDDDEDVLITGGNNAGDLVSKLYTNNGLGDFTEVANTPFENVQFSSISFADVDGDEDQDVLITGNIDWNERITKLYFNDGSGNFTEALSTPFEAVESASTAFSDIDGDDDLDLFISGFTGMGSRSAKIYINNGNGVFTEKPDIPFEGADGGTVDFSDFDGDGDEDVLVTGFASSVLSGIAILYANDGAGNFTEVPGTPFLGLFSSSSGLADIDGDGDKDILFIGSDDSFEPITKLYNSNLIMTALSEAFNSLKFEFSLFPIPATADKLNVKYESTGTVNIRLFDVNGQHISNHWESIQIDNSTISIDISSFHKGAYLIQLSDEEKTGIKKFIVH